MQTKRVNRDLESADVSYGIDCKTISYEDSVGICSTINIEGSIPQKENKIPQRNSLQTKRVNRDFADVFYATNCKTISYEYSVSICSTINIEGSIPQKEKKGIMSTKGHPHFPSEIFAG